MRPDQLQEKNFKKTPHKHVKDKEYATKQSVGHWRSQRGKQTILRDKWKQKHNDSKSMGHSKSSSKREVYNKHLYLKKQEKSQINSLILYLKELEKEEQT